MSDILSTAGKNKKNLAVVFGLTTTYLIAEVIGGLLTNSLALLADAGHMLTDAGAIGLALLAIWFAERPATPEKTYGYYRVEMLAALTNAVVLLFISLYILYEAWRRWQDPPEVMSWPMLIVATIGLGVNLISMRLLADASGKSLNIKGAYLEVLSDMLGSLGVIAASVIMLTTGWYRADPLISAGIGLFIMPRTWTLLKEVTHILMEGTPIRIDLKGVEEAMKRVEGVKAVHDLHVWTITSGVDAMSAHITVEDSVQGDRILAELPRALKDQFEIEHTTIQLEVERCEENGRRI
jgi:cobalt-zinc-cadmium efflux system protein